jgi:hypothetical protein
VNPDRSLVRGLSCLADDMRDLYTSLGARAYEVHLVHTQWSGGQRGLGVQNVLSDVVLLPTPLVTSFDGLATELLAVGSNEQGTLRVSQISPRYDEFTLRGWINGEPLDEGINFFYEVYFPQPLGQTIGPRRRFTVSGIPEYRPLEFQWVLTLTKANSNREPDGEME